MIINVDQLIEEEQAMENYVYVPRKKEIEFKGRGPNSERAYWIDLTAQMLKKPFIQILGVTRDWPIEWLKEMYSVCSKANTPSRLWWGLRKKNQVIHK